MANKRIKDLTEKSSFVSGDYFPIDNSNGTKKVNASKIMTPLSSAQTDATRALNMIRSTSSFPTGDAYSSSSSYKVGDMVIYNNTLYRCKTACSPASWSVNTSNFEATSLASALTDLNNDLSTKQNKTWTRLYNNSTASSISPNLTNYTELLFFMHDSQGGSYVSSSIPKSYLIEGSTFVFGDMVELTSPATRSYMTAKYNNGTITISKAGTRAVSFTLYAR